ncbi:MAG: hypothetical protein Salg2KO_10600 [Salibacteraceae bacterium]
MLKKLLATFFCFALVLPFNTPLLAQNEPINPKQLLESISSVNDSIKAGNQEAVLKNLDSITAKVLMSTDTVVLSFGFGIAEIHRRIHRYKTAASISERTLAASRALGDSLNWSRSLYYLGLTYKKLGLENRGLEALYEGLTIAEAQNDQKRTCLILIQIGIIKKSMKRLDEALEALNSAYAISQELNEESLAGSILNNQGSIYKLKGDYNRSKELFLKAVEINKRLGNESNLSYNYNNLANVFEETGDLSRALLYQNKSIEIKKRLGNEPMLAMSYANLSIIYRKMGDITTAKKWATEALSLAKQFRNASAVTIAYKELISVSIAEGNFETAFELSQELMSIKDSIDNRDKNATLRELEAQYKRQAALKEKERLMQDISMNEQHLYEKNAFIILFGVCLVALIVLFSLYYQSIKSVSETESTMERLEAENQSLKILSETQNQRLMEVSEQLQETKGDMQIINIAIHQGLRTSAAAMIAHTSHGQNDAQRIALQRFIAHRIQWRIDDLHDIQSIRNGQFALNHKSFSFDGLMNHLLEFFDPLMQLKDIELIRDVGDDHPHIVADERRFEQIISNLLDSSIAHTQEGFVRVSSTMSSKADGTADLEVIVEDSGVGFTNVYLKRITSNSSFSLEENNLETADLLFGLRAAYRIAESMQGKIDIVNKESVGTLYSFSVNIPVVRPSKG